MVFNNFTSDIVLFVITGLCVFAGDSDTYVTNVGGTAYLKRWGYWIFVPAVFTSVMASILYCYNFIYKNYLIGGFYNHFEYSN